jgi:hypothetical protein
MTEIIRQDDEVQEAIRRLFVGSVPERSEELSEHRKNLDLVFQLLPDIHVDGRIIMDAGSYRYVRFNHRVVRSFWIGAFAAWEGYRAVAESEDIYAVDLTRFKELISAFELNIQNAQSDEAPLPFGVPEPGILPDRTIDPQGRAAAELAIIALGWALLHEVRHIQHQREGTSASNHGNQPEYARREELSCDEFATQFIVAQMPYYSSQSGDSEPLVRRKREMAIYFALFTLVLLAKDKWQESNSHPAVQHRIDCVCRLIGGDRDELAEAIAYTAFASLKTLWPAAPILSFPPVS